MRLSPLAILISVLLLSTETFAQVRKKPALKDFIPVCDSLAVMLHERTSVFTPDNELRLRKVMIRGGLLDFYFDDRIGGYPWRDEDVKWLRGMLQDLMPEGYRDCHTGNIYAGSVPLKDLIIPAVSNDGECVPYKYKRRKLRDEFVSEVGKPSFSRGLSGRNIALWQSHGRYYNATAERWEWQRAPFFTTVEDMFTQSFVLPFIIPMLENAGAYVMTPRERDCQKLEFIIDNDLSFSGDRDSLTRRCGIYKESGRWTDAGIGFADTARTYRAGVNPFGLGSARQAACTGKKSPTAGIRWIPDIPARDRYAVYVSYKTLPNSTGCAHYSVHHLGGVSEFSVNQRMGGGTWIYLGTFEFDKGSQGYVSLDNIPAPGHVFTEGTAVSADAVKIGGGMGKIARGPVGDIASDELCTSGLPSYAEGAYYWMQWAGVDTVVTNKWEGDYTRDYASRGAWTKMIKDEKNIPIDLSLAIHSDAGIKQCDSTIGTLAIYTLRCDGSRKFGNGNDRMSCRALADVVQSQFCDDVRTLWDKEWSRRDIRDRSYSESRTSDVPALLLEMLSHQNFADMKYGLDPAFRFTAARAVYKGTLKFLSMLYGEPYTVQPLPPTALAVCPGNAEESAIISWKAVEDPLEPTALPEKYILYTRVDDGGFDNGVILETVRQDCGRMVAEVPVRKGHLYSFKLAAANEGGISFPTEILCMGIPDKNDGRRVMVVNNFDRISGPAWIDSEEYAGFDCDLDAGVPYMTGTELVGRQYEFRRDREFVSNAYPGFGASHDNQACREIKGNTFDFVSIHARALMMTGHCVYSVSRDAWTEDSSLGHSAFAADILCGKQVSTVTCHPDDPVRFSVFPEKLRCTVKEFADNGGHLIISGADIATDVWSCVYPVKTDSADNAAMQGFVSSVFGYKWFSGFGSKTGQLKRFRNRKWPTTGLPRESGFDRESGKDIYRVENPDALSAASPEAFPVMRYSDSNLNAGIYYKSGTHKAVSYGFPLETLGNREDLRLIFVDAIRFFDN
ncbi:MAG: xanthan lyase [Bacteroidales bacterium]|nr:xanthan lyase [Bacteroidales bacterium]